MILLWRNITGSALMRRWKEKRRGVSIAPLRAPIRPNSRRWNTSLGSRSGECVITVKSSGAASCFTSRKSWPKSPWGSNRLTRTDGNCVTVFISLEYSMKEPKTLAYQGFDLTGRTAVVIGGTSGIGHAIALALAEAGADVVPTSRRAEQVGRAAREIQQSGRRSLEVVSDVGDRASLDNLLHKCIEA